MTINYTITFTSQEIESAATLKRELNHLKNFVNGTNVLIMNRRVYDLQTLIRIEDFLNDIVVSQNQTYRIGDYNAD